MDGYVQRCQMFGPRHSPHMFTKQLTTQTVYLVQLQASCELLHSIDEADTCAPLTSGGWEERQSGREPATLITELLHQRLLEIQRGVEWTGPVKQTVANTPPDSTTPLGLGIGLGNWKRQSL